MQKIAIVVDSNSGYTQEEADKAGIKTFVVEQDSCKGDPFDSIKMSYDYITKTFMA